MSDQQRMRVRAFLETQARNAGVPVGQDDRWMADLARRAPTDSVLEAIEMYTGQAPQVGGPAQQPQMPYQPSRMPADSNGGGGPYDEEQFMPMPGGQGGPLPPQAYRGGQSQVMIDYLMDRGAQSGANGFLNNRLMDRLQPEPVTDMQMMQRYGGDGSPVPDTGNPRARIMRELMK
jgi:hypothetical protein